MTGMDIICFGGSLVCWAVLFLRLLLEPCAWVLAAVTLLTCHV